MNNVLKQMKVVCLNRAGDRRAQKRTVKGCIFTFEFAVLWEDGFMVCLRVSLFGFTFYGSYCIFVSVVFGHKFLWLCSRVQNFGQTERCLWQLESGHFFFSGFPPVLRISFHQYISCPNIHFQVHFTSYARQSGDYKTLTDDCRYFILLIRG